MKYFRKEGYDVCPTATKALSKVRRYLSHRVGSLKDRKSGAIPNGANGSATSAQLQASPLSSNSNQKSSSRANAASFISTSSRPKDLH
ncbi:hypothetical protein AMTR_s00107p00149120 [Amborella trichopoda]|uniref:Uncharacterized protein n=1 Tax=Amborella trichopoda TaxID=13333 RepID=W1NT06_AMBTC|nr:hypothetical protein AMTR_s00107p00149120 [Amborella trichopoda]